MQSEWPACLAATLKYEGGNDDDPRDPGGRTSRGILQREWTPYVKEHPGENLPADVWKAPQSAVEDIYRTEYWDAIQGDAWPAGCDMTVWDAGVNSGVSRAGKWAGAALGVDGTWTQLAAKAASLPDKTTFIHSYASKRLSFLHGLRTFATFGHGWTTRVAGVEALSCKMALAAAGNTDEQQKTILQNKADNASAKAGQHAGGTAAAVGASGTLITQLQNHPILVGVLITGIALLAAYMIWNWYVHDTRTSAMEAVATS